MAETLRHSGWTLATVIVPLLLLLAMACGSGDAVDGSVPSDQAVQKGSDFCDEAYWRRPDPFFPGSENNPPAWASISSIPSWRDVDAGEMRAELDGGADTAATDKHGGTLLRWATTCSDRPKVIALLLDRGADVNARTIYAETPLHRAVSNGVGEVVELLLDHGAEVDAREHHGATPLINAGNSQDPKIITLLLDRGADVQAETGYGYTVLHTASERHGPDVVRTLLDRGADPGARTFSGATPLHFAAANNQHLEVLKLLVEGGADIYAKADDGDTPFHWASGSNELPVVEFLLNHGADVNAPGERGSLRCTSQRSQPTTSGSLRRCWTVERK